MHFKDNRAMSNAAFVYDVGSGGGSESNKVGLGDTSNPARPRAGAVGAGAAGGGPAAAATVGNGVDGGSGKVVEETLQDAVLAEKVRDACDDALFDVVRCQADDGDCGVGVECSVNAHGDYREEDVQRHLGIEAATNCYMTTTSFFLPRRGNNGSLVARSSRRWWQDCFTEVRHVHMEMAELIKQRNREEE